MGFNWAGLGKTMAKIRNIPDAAASSFGKFLGSMRNFVDDASAAISKKRQDIINKIVNEYKSGYEGSRVKKDFSSSYLNKRKENEIFSNEIEEGIRNADGSRVRDPKPKREKPLKTKKISKPAETAASGDDIKNPQAKNNQANANVNNNANQVSNGQMTMNFDSSGNFTGYTEEVSNSINDAADIAEEIAETGAGDFSGIGEFVHAHPFIAAGIAGGIGVAGGAILFDDDDDY